MKRKIILVIMIIFALLVTGGYFVYYKDNVRIADVTEMTLTGPAGTVKLAKPNYKQYIDLYNKAKWVVPDQAYIVNISTSLDVKIVKQDNSIIIFSISPNKDDDTLILAKEVKTAVVESSPEMEALLFDEDLLASDDMAFVAPALPLTSSSKAENIMPSSFKWTYRNIFGENVTKVVDVVGITADNISADTKPNTSTDVASANQTDRDTLATAEQSLAGIVEISETSTAIDLKLDSELEVDKIDASAIYNGQDYQCNLENNQLELLPLLGKVNYQIVVKTKPTQLGVYRAVGEIVYDIELDQRFKPRAEIQQNEQTVGGFFIISGQYFDDETELVVEQSIVDMTIDSYRVGSERFAVIPLNYYASVGEHEIVLYAVKGEQKTELTRQTVLVKDRQYGMQHLKISASKEQSTRSEKAYKQYHERFMPVRENSEPEQLWQGQFILPLEGRLTTDYGTKRKINDILTRYRHNGLDLAAPTGTEIKAANSGKIVFSEELILTGNTIIIDHGLGFFTYYLHMNERRAAVDDMVEKGQVIGTVGTTGFSTGPHLHFTASYHLKNINPYLLLEWDGKWHNQDIKDSKGE